MGSTGGWNRSAANQPTAKKGGAKVPSKVRGVVAGLVTVCALGGLCLWMFSGGEDAPKAKAEKERGRIKAVTPAAAPTNVVSVVPEKPARLSKKGTPIPDAVQKDEKGVLRWPSGLRWVDTNDLHVVKRPMKRKLFTHACDNHIADILTRDPTRMAPILIGKRRPYGEAFVEDFKASMNDTTVIDKEDTPEEREVRKRVLETKADLKAALDRGEDIAKIMNDAQDELDRLCQYQDNLRKMVREAARNPELSDDDVRDYVKAANEMLEKQGIKKMALPSLVYRQADLAIRRERELLKKGDNK